MFNTQTGKLCNGYYRMYYPYPAPIALSLLSALFYDLRDYFKYDLKAYTQLNNQSQIQRTKHLAGEDYYNVGTQIINPFLYNNQISTWTVKITIDDNHPKNKFYNDRVRVHAHIGVIEHKFQHKLDVLDNNSKFYGVNSFSQQVRPYSNCGEAFMIKWTKFLEKDWILENDIIQISLITFNNECILKILKNDKNIMNFTLQYTKYSLCVSCAREFESVEILSFNQYSYK